MSMIDQKWSWSWSCACEVDFGREESLWSRADLWDAPIVGEKA